MNKRILRILPACLLLCSCSNPLANLRIGNWYPFGKPTPIKETTHVEGDPIVISDDKPQDLTQHATSMSQDPNAPFYVKVGETRDISVTLSPSPTLDSEKKIEWEIEGENFIDYTVDPKNEGKTNKVSVTGKAAGTATLTATNEYNSSLSKKFTIKVINFNEEDDYLWQYKSADRAEFGYDSKEAKLGTTEGDANLNGIVWHYTRSRATSLQSSMGAVGFGKGSEPETHVHLETTTDRLVNKFTIEAASANSLAKMTIKVGNTIYMDEKSVPKDDWDVIQTLTSDTVLPDTGKIEIDVYTPEFESNRADDPTYKKPGAFYLKSILINFKTEVIEGIKLADDSEHITDFFKGEVFTLEGMKLQKYSSRNICIDVDIDAEEEAGNLTYVVESFDTASHEAKEVKLSLVVEGYDNPFELIYYIHVREESWLPESMEVLGTVQPQLLVEGDEVDYSGLTIKVVYSASSEDYMICKFAESDVFSFSYGSDGDPFVAEKVMESGYTITVIGYFVPVDGVRTEQIAAYLTVPSGTLSITEAIYDRIDFRRSAQLQKIVDAGLKTDAGSLTYTYEKTNRVRLDFDKVSKGNRLSDNKELPKTLSNFYLTILDNNLSIDKLNIEFANASKKVNNYRLFASIYGGDIYGEELTQAKNHKIVYDEFVNHVNNVLLAPGLTSTGSTVNANTCICSILIRYKEQSHLTYDLSYGTTTPNKMEYLEGEEFDPTGLEVMLTETGAEESLDVTQYISWYDGSSYTSEPQKTLLPASTYVVGVFHEKTFQVAITSVQAVSIPVSRVTNISDIDAEGHYYLTCPSGKLILKGSSKNGDLFTGNGSEQFEDLAFGDNMQLNILLENDFIMFTPLENGKFKIYTYDKVEKKIKGYFGLTKGGSETCSATCPNTEWDVTVDESGLFSASITAMAYKTDGTEKGEVTMYLGANISSTSKVIKPYTSDKANLSLYKVVA